MSYDKTISADLYDQKWEDGTITITMKRGASVPVIVIKVTGAELTGSYTLSVKADAGAAEWSAAKTGELSGDSVVAYFTKPGAEPFFVDVVSGAWYESTVRYAAEAGLMAGTGDGRFSPEVTTTRGMIVTILYRLENEPAVSGGSAFTDVENGAWYADAVAWAAANDIVNGTSATTFAPNSPITREQMAAILYRYAAYKGYDVSQKADLSGYTDAASISGYAKDALAWANAQKLITGVTDTTLNPQGSATRAQVATILMRLCETVVK